MNTKNKIAKTAILLLTTLILTGCDLTLIPEDSTTPENYFKSENDLQLWTNQFYTMFDDADAAAGLNADDVIDQMFQDLVGGTRSPATEGGWNWGQLRNINYFLEHSSNCEDVKIRTQYEGLAYFFRAYFYFLKVRRYGDVPWYDHVLTSNDESALKKPRDSRGYVMDRVLEDFDRAIEMLPTSKQVARITKWSALAFKSRAALYEGTFRKYHGMTDYDKYLQSAADAAEEFITHSGYKIYTAGSEPYRQLFNSNSAITDEVVLTQIYNAAGLQLGTSIPASIRNERRGFTRRFMNHYLMADGTRFSSQAGNATMLYKDEIKSRDPRMAQTVLCPGYIQKEATKETINLLSSVTGYQPIKFVGTTAEDGASKSNMDFPLMRAAEVYLNFAEAKAELGTLNQNDLKISVNKIRARVNMPALDMEDANADIDPLMKSYYPNVTQSANTGIILEIRRERTVELVMEGIRQWDMLRWFEGRQIVNKTSPYWGCYFPGPGVYDMNGDGVNDIELYVGTASSSLANKFMINFDIILSNGTSGNIVAFSGIVYTWDDQRDYLWPIPAQQRVLTQGALTQNPGWVDGVDL